MKLVVNQDGTVAMSVGVHAPKGGATIAGKHFTGGEFIPKGILAQASAEDKAKLKPTRAGYEAVKGNVVDTGKVNPKTNKPVFKKADDKYVHAGGEGEITMPMLQRIRTLKIPPGHMAKGVVLARDPKAKIQAVATDAQGKDHYFYRADHHEQAAVAKWKRVAAFMAKGGAFEKVQANVNKAIHGPDSPMREASLVLAFMAHTGIRVDSEGAVDTRVKSYGASTLEPRHVQVDGDTVHYDFIGKEGVRNYGSFSNPVIAREVERRLKQDRPKLFDTNYSAVTKTFKQLGGGGFLVKDLRTAVANETAYHAIEGMPAPTTPDEYQAQRIRVGQIVGRKLNHAAERGKGKIGPDGHPLSNHQMSLDNYINPEVFIPWKANLERLGFQVSNDSGKQSKPSTTSAPKAKKPIQNSGIPKKPEKTQWAKGSNPAAKMALGSQCLALRNGHITLVDRWPQGVNQVVESLFHGDIEPENAVSQFRGLLCGQRMSFVFIGPKTGRQRVVSSRDEIPKTILRSGQYTEHKDLEEHEIKKMAGHASKTFKGLNVPGHLHEQAMELFHLGAAGHTPMEKVLARFREIADEVRNAGKKSRGETVAPVKETKRTLRTAATELQGIRNELASSAKWSRKQALHMQIALSAKVDEIGKWVAANGGNTGLSSKLLVEAHRLRDKLGGNGGVRIQQETEHIAAIKAKMARSAEMAEDDDVISDDIEAAMSKIDAEARGGALVSIRDLRKSMGNPASLDKALLDMAAQGKLALHKHDLPASLPPAERASLLKDAQGNEYVGIALRPSGDSKATTTHNSIESAMAKLNPEAANGAAVSIAELRKALGNPDGFDKMLLDLEDKGKLRLLDARFPGVLPSWHPAAGGVGPGITDRNKTFLGVALPPKKWADVPKVDKNGREFTLEMFNNELDAAFDNLGKNSRGFKNFLFLSDLRKALPHYTSDQFNAALRELRFANKYAGMTSEGLTVTLTPEQRIAGITEGGRLLAYLQRVTDDRSSKDDDESAQKKNDAVAEQAGPKEGDRNEAGLVFKGGRWHREEQEQAVSTSKEPWEMTEEEYDKAHGNRGMAKGNYESEIEQALQDGKPVPRNVAIEFDKTTAEHQPHILTAKEFRQATGRDSILSAKGPRAKAEADKEHRAAVASVLAAGKPVPAEVLADYPDLVKKAETEGTHPKAEQEPHKMTPEEYQRALSAKLLAVVDAGESGGFKKGSIKLGPDGILRVYRGKKFGFTKPSLFEPAWAQAAHDTGMLHPEKQQRAHEAGKPWEELQKENEQELSAPAEASKAAEESPAEDQEVKDIKAAINNVGGPDELTVDNIEKIRRDLYPKYGPKITPRIVRAFAEQIRQSVDVSKPGNEKQAKKGPKEGDKNAEGLVFHNSRWHREGAVDALDITPDNVAEHIAQETKKLLSDGRTYSPNLAAQMAAGRILKAFDKRAGEFIESIDARVQEGDEFTEQEDELYASMRNRRRALYDALVRETGYRPGAIDPDHPDLDEPLGPLGDNKKPAEQQLADMLKGIDKSGAESVLQQYEEKKKARDIQVEKLQREADELRDSREGKSGPALGAINRKIAKLVDKKAEVKDSVYADRDVYQAREALLAHDETKPIYQRYAAAADLAGDVNSRSWNARRNELADMLAGVAGGDDRLAMSIATEMMRVPLGAEQIIAQEKDRHARRKVVERLHQLIDEQPDLSKLEKENAKARYHDNSIHPGRYDTYAKDITDENDREKQQKQREREAAEERQRRVDAGIKITQAARALIDGKHTGEPSQDTLKEAVRLLIHEEPNQWRKASKDDIEHKGATAKDIASGHNKHAADAVGYVRHDNAIIKATPAIKEESGKRYDVNDQNFQRIYNNQIERHLEDAKGKDEVSAKVVGRKDGHVIIAGKDGSGKKRKAIVSESAVATILRHHPGSMIGITEDNWIVFTNKNNEVTGVIGGGSTDVDDESLVPPKRLEDILEPGPYSPSDVKLQYSTHKVGHFVVGNHGLSRALRSKPPSDLNAKDDSGSIDKNLRKKVLSFVHGTDEDGEPIFHPKGKKSDLPDEHKTARDYWAKLRELSRQPSLGVDENGHQRVSENFSIVQGKGGWRDKPDGTFALKHRKSGSTLPFKADSVMKAKLLAHALEHMDGVNWDRKAYNLDDPKDKEEIEMVKGVAAAVKEGDYHPAMGGHAKLMKISKAIHEEADRSGISARELKYAVNHVHEMEKQQLGDRAAAIDAVRAKLGLTSRKIADIENSGRDHSTIPKFDDIARSVAREYPDLAIGPGYESEINASDEEDYGQKLWNILREPTPRPRDPNDPSLISDAANLVLSDKPVTKVADDLDWLSDDTVEDDGMGQYEDDGDREMSLRPKKLPAIPPCLAVRNGHVTMVNRWPQGVRGIVESLFHGDTGTREAVNQFRSLLYGQRMSFVFIGPRTKRQRVVSSRDEIPKSILKTGRYTEHKDIEEHEIRALAGHASRTFQGLNVPKHLHEQAMELFHLGAAGHTPMDKVIERFQEIAEQVRNAGKKARGEVTAPAPKAVEPAPAEPVAPMAPDPLTAEPDAVKESVAPHGAKASDIPYDTAYNAHRNTSFVPERRAKQRQADYVNRMESDYNDLAKLANTEDKRKQLAEEFARYREGYKSKYLAVLHAASRTASPMITGPARFPVDQNRKRIDTEDKRRMELDEFRKRAMAAIQKKLAPETSVVQSNDPNAVETLNKQLAEAESMQERMKLANAIVRKHATHQAGKFTGQEYQGGQTVWKAGKSEATLREELAGAGLSERWIDAIVKPNYRGKIGVEDFQLTNNNANIRRIKGRIAELSKMKAGSATEAKYSGGVTVSEDPEAARIRIRFPDKPSKDVIGKLKSRGFRWSPTESAWQRHLNNGGRHATESVLAELGHKKEGAEGKEEAANVPPVTATQIIQLPSGQWGFAGKVDMRLEYLRPDGTYPADSEIDGVMMPWRMFGESFGRNAAKNMGLVRQSYKSREEAEQAVERLAQHDTTKANGPKEGDKNAEGLVFHDGRWHREEVAQAAEKEPHEMTQEDQLDSVDARIAAAKKRESETPKANKTIPIPGNILGAIRDELRIAVPGVRVVGGRTKSGHVQIYPPSTEPFTVEQGNLIRAALRRYGIVDAVDGLHMADIDYRQSVIGNLVMDADGPNPLYQSDVAPTRKPDWQTTVHDYVSSHPDASVMTRKLESVGTGQLDGMAIGHRIRSQHRDAVKAALAAGKPVPPEVLAEYPDIAQKAEDAPEDGPQEGDRNAEGLIFRDSRWHREETAQAAEKEPHEMTRDEYRKYFDDGGKDPMPMSGADAIASMDWGRKHFGPDAKNRLLHGDAGDTQHLLLIANQLRQGKPVPPEVLAGYPDIAKANTTPEPVATNTEGSAASEQGTGTGAGAIPDAGGDRPGSGVSEQRRVDSGDADGPVRQNAGNGTQRVITDRSEFTSPANLEKVPEHLRQHLKPEQQFGVAKALEAMDRYGGFLLADGTGVGKTRQLLAIADNYAKQGKKVVIVAPAEVIKPKWDKGTTAKTGSYNKDATAMGVGFRLARGSEPLPAGTVNLTTYNNIGDIAKQADSNTVVLFDESHYMKNSSSARSKHGKTIGFNAGKVMYATATPADKALHLGHLLRAGVFGGGDERSGKFWGKAADTYTKLGLIQKTVYNRHAGREITKWEVNPRVGTEEVSRRISGLMDQMTKDGLMVQRTLSMDNIDARLHPITLSDEAKRATTKVYDDMMDEHDNKAIALMAMRRSQEPHKISEVGRLVQEELAAGRQPIVFLGRVNDLTADEDDDEDDSVDDNTAKLLRQHLLDIGISEADIGELHGAATKTADAKSRAMEHFNDGKTKVLISTIQSGGTGVNLDDTVGDRPRTVIMMTPPLSANDMIQAAGRVNRLTTKSPAKLVTLVSDHEVDEWNMALLAKKMETSGAALAKNMAQLIEKHRPAETDRFDWGQSLIRTKLPAGAPAGATTTPEPAPQPVGPAQSPFAEKPAVKFTAEQKRVIHAAAKWLHSLNDDRAREVNGMGYNKFDGEHGAALANLPELSDAQAERGLKMLRKYQGQLNNANLTLPHDSHIQRDEPPKQQAVGQPTKKVNTKNGERHIISWRPTSKFWDLRKAGKLPSEVSVKKNDRTGDWEATIWGTSPDHANQVYDKLRELGGQSMALKQRTVTDVMAEIVRILQQLHDGDMTSEEAEKAYRALLSGGGQAMSHNVLKMIRSFKKAVPLKRKPRGRRNVVICMENNKLVAR